MPSTPGRRRGQAQRARKRQGNATTERVSLESGSPMDHVGDGRSDRLVEAPAVVPYRIVTHELPRRRELNSRQQARYTRRRAESPGGTDAKKRGKGAEEESNSAEEGSRSVEEFNGFDEGSVNPTEEITAPTQAQEIHWPERTVFEGCSNQDPREALLGVAFAHPLDPEADSVQSNPAPPSVPTFRFEVRPQTAPYSAGQHRREPCPDTSSCIDALVEENAVATPPSAAPTSPCMVNSGTAFSSSPQQPAFSISPPEGVRISPVTESPPSDSRRSMITHDQQRCVPARPQCTASFGQSSNRYLSHGPFPCYVHPRWTSHSLQPQESSFPLRSKTRVSIPPGFESVFEANPARNGNTFTNHTSAKDATPASRQALSAQTPSCTAGGLMTDPQSPPNPFRPVWSEYEPREESKPLPKPTWALEHAWANGLPLPLSANALERPRSIYKSSQTGRYHPTLTSATLVEDSQFNPINDPAVVEAKLAPASLLMRRTDTAARLFELAVKAEEERLAKKRTKAELKAHLLNLTKAPGLEEGAKEAVQEPISPKKAPPETRKKQSYDAKPGSKEEERRECLAEGSDNWWDSETLPDDDWEFVEWPPMSGLIWKSSGLDRLVLGLEDTED